MLPDEEERPRIGSERNMLGVRPGVDVKEEPAGPGRGGISVTANVPTKMPAPIRPKSFGGLNGETVMYDIEEPRLEHYALRRSEVDPRTLHAVIEPDATCAIAELQRRLARTREEWSRTATPRDDT